MNTFSTVAYVAFAVKIYIAQPQLTEEANQQQISPLRSYSTAERIATQAIQLIPFQFMDYTSNFRIVEVAGEQQKQRSCI